MLVKHVIFPFSSMNYMFFVNYIFLLNSTYVFAIITCLGFVVLENVFIIITVTGDIFYIQRRVKGVISWYGETETFKLVVMASSITFHING